MAELPARHYSGALGQEEGQECKPDGSGYRAWAGAREELAGLIAAGCLALITIAGWHNVSQALQTLERGEERMSEKINGQELHPMVLELARGQNFAALTTLLPGGHPQTQVMWIDANEQHLLVNTEVHRQKFRNVERDPRVTVTIWDMEDPYRFVEVRGEVVEKVKGQEAREHIDELSHKYRGKPYQPQIKSERVVLRIAPSRQVIRIPS